MSNMMMKGIVLNASTYSFVNEKENRRVEGINLSYILTDNLNPTQADERGNRGYVPAKCTLPYDMRSELTEVPGVYDFEMNMVVNKQTQRGEVRVVGARFYAPISDAVVQKMK